MASATPPIGREATAAAGNGWNLPTDTLVEILLRLPPTKRWRLRLVCRHWRDVIRDRTPAPAPPTALAFVVSSAEYTAMSASAFAIDDPALGRCREVWRSSNPRPQRRYNEYHRHVYERNFDTAMVGTCNGVLCLCDNKRPGGAISLANPATGESLALPPLPCSGHWQEWGTTIRSWHEAYAFAHDPNTWRYTVVHVPSFFDRNGVFAALNVFTLGGDGSSPPASTTWREVPVAGAAASCRLDAGFVAIDGTLHWVTEGTERVVAFDLAAERVTSTMALPAPEAGRGSRWCLTEVRGRLGAVDYSAERCWGTPEMTHVWVLDGGGRDDRRRQVWSRRYSVQVYRVEQWLAAPQFAFGEHVLTTEAPGGRGVSASVFAHRMPPGRLRIGWKAPGVRVSGISSGDSRDDSVRIHGVFGYVENKEPLKRFTTIHKLRD
ncbi:unnamed protein product [Urochloa decumbens]|uniref:F-box domain-containing protein n=1 Tax=Urochloa decumbens TaxID=240449 RepID=A0ABC9BVP0_9POAL